MKYIRLRDRVRWKYPSLSPEEKEERYYKYWQTLPKEACPFLTYDSIRRLGHAACLPASRMQQAIRLATVRLQSSAKAQFVADAIGKLQHFASPAAGTVLLSRCGDDSRVVWHPRFLAGLDVEHTAYAICHEAAHLALDSQRTAVKCYGYRPPSAYVLAFNVASDLEIEQLLSDLRDIRIPGVFQLGGFCPYFWVDLDFPEGLDTAGYYEHLAPYAKSRWSPYREACRRLDEQRGI